MLGKSEWYFIWGLFETSYIINANDHDWLTELERSHPDHNMEIRMFLMWQEAINNQDDL